MAKKELIYNFNIELGVEPNQENVKNAGRSYIIKDIPDLDSLF